MCVLGFTSPLPRSLLAPFSRGAFVLPVICCSRLLHAFFFSLPPPPPPHPLRRWWGEVVTVCDILTVFYIYCTGNIHIFKEKWSKPARRACCYTQRTHNTSANVGSVGAVTTTHQGAPKKSLQGGPCCTCNDDHNLITDQLAGKWLDSCCDRRFDLWSYRRCSLQLPDVTARCFCCSFPAMGLNQTSWKNI